MKIVFIGSRSLNSIGGIETYMKNLCPLLVKKEYEVILYSEDKNWSSYDYKGVKVITIPSIKSKFLNKIIASFLATIHSLVFNRNVDIYHYNAVGAGFFSFIPKIFAQTVVFQGHGFEWQRAKWSGKIKKIIKAVDLFTIRINNHITMVSEEQSRYIRSLDKESVTITPGVDIVDDTIESDIFNKFNIKRNSYVLYLGRLVQEKKADLLIESFNSADLKDLQLIIAGDDPSEKQFIKSLHQKGSKNNNIIFLGAVFGDDKEALLQNCSAFCIPSELEGLPITLLEAMSYGKICIASDIPAHIEALDDTGLFFSLNDSEDLKNKLIALENGSIEQKGYLAKRRIKEKFTWNRIANKFDRFYKKIKEK